ncbi:adaptor complexes small subunit family, partial [Rhizoctonia solani]
MSKNKTTSTAWASKKQGGGSLTSDLLTPRRPSPAPTQSQSKRSKGPSSPAGLPKSAEVRRLERLIDEVSTGVVDSRVANRPGCFCLARAHELSHYVPICIHCGIILCSLHNPALPCPSCSSPLLPPATRNALLLQLQEELALQIHKEDEKIAEEMRIAKEIELHNSGGGNFPTLTGKPDSKPAQNLPRKVISIGSGKKATVSTFISVPSPAVSTPNSGRTSPVEERIPPPPQTAICIELDPELKLLQRQRPWVDLLDPTPVYQPKQPQQQSEDAQSRGGGGRSRKRGRGRGRGGENGGARTPYYVVPSLLFYEAEPHVWDLGLGYKYGLNHHHDSVHISSANQYMLEQTRKNTFVQMFRNYKVVYRRYAGLFFCVCVDANDNELAYLEAIHLFVEVLDQFFQNVCELDLVFNFYKVYAILDEVFLAGEIEETSKDVVMARLEELEKLE